MQRKYFFKSLIKKSELFNSNDKKVNTWLFQFFKVIDTFPDKIRKRYILNDIYIKFITGFSRLHSFFHHIFINISLFSQFSSLSKLLRFLVIFRAVSKSVAPCVFYLDNFFSYFLRMIPFLLKSDLWKYYTYYIW